MPRTINQGFLDFHQKLTPTSTESESSKRHRTSIENSLKSNFTLRRFFRSGSFGNGTSISGYSDVDYFASLSGDVLKQNSAYTLRLIKDVLDKRFPNTGVHISSPAVVVPFGSNPQEATEIVPADYMSATDDRQLIYDIPDCNGDWMKSSPDIHGRYVANLNIRLGYKLKPLIRFIKAWKYYNNVPISSFYLEMRAAKFCESESSIVYSIDLHNFFKYLDSTNLAALYDPTGISGAIVPTFSSLKLIEARSKVNTALSRANKAREAEKEEKTSDAFIWWKAIFGDKFPTYYY